MIKEIAVPVLDLVRKAEIALVEQYTALYSVVTRKLLLEGELPERIPAIAQSVVPSHAIVSRRFDHINTKQLPEGFEDKIRTIPSTLADIVFTDIVLQNTSSRLYRMALDEYPRAEHAIREVIPEYRVDSATITFKLRPPEPPATVLFTIRPAPPPRAAVERMQAIIDRWKDDSAFRPLDHHAVTPDRQ